MYGSTLPTPMSSLPDNLYRDLAGELGVGLPVILVEGILDGDDRVLADEPLVHVRQLVRRQLKQGRQSGFVLT